MKVIPEETDATPRCSPLLLYQCHFIISQVLISYINLQDITGQNISGLGCVYSEDLDLVSFSVNYPD